MTSRCSVEQTGGFVSDTLYAIDCLGLQIGSEGFQVLSAPGGTGRIILTSVLTIFVALFGYRMMLGETPNTKIGVVSIATIGIVLAFSTSWSAFRIGVHDVIVYAPAELSKSVAQAVGIPGNRELIERLDGINSLMITLEKPVLKPAVSQPPNPPDAASSSTSSSPQNAQPNGPDLSPSTITPDLRPWFLIGAIGPLAATRLAASLLIALAPLFFMALLFPTLRGFFSGWLRTLLGLAVAQFALMLALGIEVLLVEGRLSMILRGGRIQSEIAARTPELHSLFFAFGGILISLIIIGIWGLSGFKLDVLARRIVEHVGQNYATPVQDRATSEPQNVIVESQSRAFAVVRPLIRDAQAKASDPRWQRSDRANSGSSEQPQSRAQREMGAYQSPHQHRRQASRRRSLSAGRRDNVIS